MIDRKVIKQKAKDQLGNNIFSQAWMMGLLICFLGSFIIGGSGYLTFGIGTFILAGPITAGIYYAYLKQARGKEMELKDLFYPISKDFGQTFLLGLMTGIFVFLWSLLLVIPGIIAAYSYEMAFNIKIDHPELDWYSCIKASKRMTKGHKWELFVLDLSFIGWAFVGMLCLGVGTLWVAAYQQAARTQFYEALVAEENMRTQTVNI